MALSGFTSQLQSTHLSPEACQLFQLIGSRESHLGVSNSVTPRKTVRKAVPPRAFSHRACTKRPGVRDPNM